jgi:glycine/D-amino acid oxidase-like deaminating enzyme
VPVAARTADVVICGAGIAGVSAAYQLAVHHGVRDVLLVDQRPPLTLTSDKSTEAYRNWWPGPDDAMVRLMNHSIDLLEELAADCGNRFLLNRRGYVYATGDARRAAIYLRTSERASAQGAGQLRVHGGDSQEVTYVRHRPDGWLDQPDGADLIVDPALIRELFPYLAPDVCAVLHTRRCGWFSGQQLGMEQLDRARASGARLLEGLVTTVEIERGRVGGVCVATPAGNVTIATRCFVNAAGPFLQPVSRLLGLELPVFSELHVKMSFRDHLGVVPRDVPLLIWEDPQRLSWTEEEAALLRETATSRWLTEEMPAGVHMRTEGAEHVIILWPYHVGEVAETFPIELPPGYAEIALRGMTRLVPGLAAYLDRLPVPFVDGGYYTKTRENRPLACPLPIEGAFLHGALSGFGLMASPATAELLARHCTGDTLPDYAPAFDLRRYDDPAYLRSLERWGDGGQL